MSIHLENSITWVSNSFNHLRWQLGHLVIFPLSFSLDNHLIIETIKILTGIKAQIDLCNRKTPEFMNNLTKIQIKIILVMKNSLHLQIILIIMKSNNKIIIKIKVFSFRQWLSYQAYPSKL